MSIFNNPFATKPAAPQTPAPANPEVGQPGNIPPVDPSAAVPAPAEPAAPVEILPEAMIVATPPEGAGDNSPLAAFEKLWDTVPTDPNSANPTTPPELTAEQLNKLVATQDFSQGVTAEQMEAVTAGGEGAVAAMQQMMNGMARSLFVQSTLVGNKLSQQTTDRAVETHTAGLPELIRKNAASNHLTNSSPLLSNPALKPVIDATRDQLLAKYPTATTEQITAMTTQYLTAMGDHFAPKPTAPVAPGEQDWGSFLES